MTHWEYFPPSHPTGARLYEYALAWVQVSPLLDTFHIVCAALNPQAPDIPVSGLIAQIIAPALRDRWLSVTVAELRAQTAGIPLSRQPAPMLLQCLDIWRQRSVDPAQPVTDVVMLATVIGVDQRIQRMMELCGIPYQVFVQSLWQSSAQAAIPGWAQSGSFPVFAPDAFGFPITGPHPALRPGMMLGTMLPAIGPRHTMPPTPFGLPAGPTFSFGMPGPSSQSLASVGIIAASISQPVSEYDALSAEIKRLVRYVDPSRDHFYAKMHAVDMNAFLDVFADSLRNAQTTIIAGHDGTPADKLPLVLADRIAQRHRFEGKQEALNGYCGIYKLDAAELHDLALVPNRPEPYKVLEETLREFASSPWLLMIDHVEVLFGGSKVAESLRALFSTRGDVPMFGLYRIDNESDADIRARVGPKVTIATIRPTSQVETRELIERFFLPRWQQQDYTFAKNAFDGVIALERGARFGGRRKYLPYLAIDLADDAMQTIRDGDNSIRTTARRAVTAIDRLKPRDLVLLRTDDRRTYDKALLEAQKEIQQLANKPFPDHENGRRKVTRAYVTAQLMGGGRGEFQYP